MSNAVPRSNHRASKQVSARVHLLALLFSSPVSVPCMSENCEFIQLTILRPTAQIQPDRAMGIARARVRENQKHGKHVCVRARERVGGGGVGWGGVQRHLKIDGVKSGKNNKSAPFARIIA